MYTQRVLDKLVSIDTALESTQAVHTGTSNSSPARLPKLNLPKFSGDLTEWTTFGIVQDFCS